MKETINIDENTKPFTSPKTLLESVLCLTTTQLKTDHDTLGPLDLRTDKANEKCKMLATLDHRL